LNKELDDKFYELNQLKSEWEQRLEENRKQQEIQKIIERKETEQRKKMELLTRGAEWIQAHWRGLLARRDAEKARKKNKKKKKAKK
jgi:hypothetical protein